MDTISHYFLHTHAPLRVAGYATRKQRCSGWFVKVINQVIKGLDRVAAYLDDVIVFDADPSLHVANEGLFPAFAKTRHAFPFKGYHRRHGRGFPLSPHLSRQHHAECTKGGIADESAHAERSETATLPFGWCFLLLEISTRYGDADAAHHLPSQTRRQVRLYSIETIMRELLAE